jgi:hypothetical protein
MMFAKSFPILFIPPSCLLFSPPPSAAKKASSSDRTGARATEPTPQLFIHEYLSPGRRVEDTREGKGRATGKILATNEANDVLTRTTATVQWDSDAQVEDSVYFSDIFPVLGPMAKRNAIRTFLSLREDGGRSGKKETDMKREKNGKKEEGEKMLARSSSDRVPHRPSGPPKSFGNRSRPMIPVDAAITVDEENRVGMGAENGEVSEHEMSRSSAGVGCDAAPFSPAQAALTAAQTAVQKDRSAADSGGGNGRGGDGGCESTQVSRICEGGEPYSGMLSVQHRAMVGETTTAQRSKAVHRGGKDDAGNGNENLLSTKPTGNLVTNEKGEICEKKPQSSAVQAPAGVPQGSAVQAARRLSARSGANAAGEGALRAKRELIGKLLGIRWFFGVCLWFHCRCSY